MSQAVVHNGIVTTAGQVAQNAKGASAADQTKDILNAIDELLTALRVMRRPERVLSLNLRHLTLLSR